MHTQVVQATQASVDVVSDLEWSIFLQWVWLVSNSIGATPTRQPSLKVFGVARFGRSGIDHSHVTVGNMQACCCRQRMLHAYIVWWPSYLSPVDTPLAVDTGSRSPMLICPIDSTYYPLSNYQKMLLLVKRNRFVQRCVVVAHKS